MRLNAVFHRGYARRKMSARGGGYLHLFYFDVSSDKHGPDRWLGVSDERVK